jgi:putative transposase
VSAYVDQHRDRFGVEPICETLGVSASAYYQRQTGERSARRVEDERLLERIREVHRDNYEAYGYRRTWKALGRAGEQAARCQVQRLMAEHGIQGAKRRGKPWRTTRSDPEALRSPDRVRRDFTAQRPNALWVGDFTYLRCWEGVLYFSFVIDVFSRMIVGWQLASNMRTTLVLDALRMALGLRAPGADFQLVAHTDAGSQYTSADYTQVLDDHEVLASIGTVGDALDNALAESFVDSYKTELISDRIWRSRAEVEHATVKWVAWFNHDRLHSSLGDIPPVEFEAHHAADPPDLSVAAIKSRVVDELTASRVSTIGVDFAVDRLISPKNALVVPNEFAQAAPTAIKGRKAAVGLSELRC